MKEGLRIPRRLVGRLSQFVAAAGVVVLVLSLNGPPQAAQALAPGDVSIIIVSGDENDTNGDGIHQEVVLDSNKPCVEGPDAAYVAFRVTNTSGGTLTDLEATLGNLVNGFTLAGGQPAAQYIGTLAAGESRTLFWYISYPCTIGIIDDVMVTVSDATASSVSATRRLATGSFISANAGGAINMTTLGPGVVIGQLIDFTVRYDFGNVQVGDDLYVQPSGLPSFDAGCFELIGSAAVWSSVGMNSIPLVPNPNAYDRLYWRATVGSGGSNNYVDIQYTFRYRCTGVAGTAIPYASLTSGTQDKYTGNYSDPPPGGGTVPTFPPPAIDPFVVTKTVDASQFLVDGTVEYTVDVLNRTDYDAYIDEIEDVLPIGVTFLSISAGSEVTAANSASIPSAGEGNGNTISFIGIPGTSYLVPAGDSIRLIYRANVAAIPGSYTNTASVRVGEETVGQDDATVVIGAQADLSVIKSDAGFDPVSAGGMVTYTVTVTNNGPNTASSVALNEALPASVVFVSATPTQGSCLLPVGNNLICDLGDIPNGGSVDVQISVLTTSASVGTMTNTASVTSGTPDPNSGNNTAAENTTVNTAGGGSVNLGVTKVDAVDPVGIGNNVVYTITVTNTGPNTATSVFLTDTLPPNMTYVSAVPSQGTCTEAFTSIINCALGSIANGGSATVIITVTVEAVGTYINPVSVQSLVETDTNLGNNTDQESTTVNASADIQVTKTDSADPVAPGTPFSYTIAVRNNGPDSAVNTRMTDILPTGVVFVSAVPTQGTCDTPVGSTLVCSLGTIPSGSTVNVVVTVIPTSSVRNTTISNWAEAISGTPDPTPLDKANHSYNNGDEETTSISQVTVRTVDLSITKTDTGFDPVNVGANVTYTLTVQNLSLVNAVTSAFVTDTIPEGTTFVSAVPSQGSCVESDGIVRCTLGALAMGDGTMGGPDTATITVTVQTTADGTITNTATVQSLVETDSNSANNTATQSTIVTPVADLSVVKTDSGYDPVDVGDHVIYRVTIINNGPDTASIVNLTDTLPGGVIYIGATPSQGGPCVELAGIVNCPLGTIAAGFSATVDVEIQTTAEGTLNNLATATSLLEVDTNPGNDSDTETTTVGSSADLSLAKEVDDATPNVGDTVTFTLTVTNAGPDDATGVTVDDLLPGGYTCAGSSDPANYDCGTGVWNVGTVVVGTPAVLTITATVDAPTGTPDEYLNYAEITASDQPDPNSTPDNGSTDEDDDATASVSPGALDPLVVVKEYSPTIIPPDGVTAATLTITISNPAGNPQATNVSFTDSLFDPALVLANASTTCPGGTAVIGAGPMLTLSGATLDAGSACTVTADVTSTTQGTYNNTVYATSDNIPDSDPDGANLGVYGGLAIVKELSPSTITPGGTSTLILTITNPRPDPVTGVAFSDTLPANVRFAATPNLTVALSCDDAGDPTFTVDTVDGPPAVISMSGGSIAAGGVCTISIDVTSDIESSYVNTTSAITADGIPDGPSATDTLVVASPPPPEPEPEPEPELAYLDPAISKAGEPQDATVGETVVWTIIISNPHSVPIGGIVVNDPIPSMFTIISVDTPVGTASVNGQVVTVHIPVLQPGQTVEVHITTVANELAIAGQVCNVAYAGQNSAEACITVYPDVLPETGGAPVIWLLGSAGALAGGGLIAVGWMVIRRRRRLLGRFP